MCDDVRGDGDLRDAIVTHSLYIRPNLIINAFLEPNTSTDAPKTCIEMKSERLFLPKTAFRQQRWIQLQQVLRHELFQDFRI